eukprot:m.193866 g.193866  ORF g.193866 m.193866 type:complete len:729 (+) comp18642_c1_seq1:136-2322(+)
MNSTAFRRDLLGSVAFVVAIVATLLSCTAPTNAQSIVANGNSINVNLPTGGQFNVQTGSDTPIGIATSDDVQDATDAMTSTMNGIQSNISMLQDVVSRLASFKMSVISCTASGLFYDEPSDSCVSPMPNTSVYATAQRVANVELNIEQIETALSGANGSHAFCNICPRNQYVVTPCNDDNNTLCAPCPTGTYSLGGFADSCMPCSAGVSNCEFGTCTSATANLSCSYCDTDVQGGRSWYLAGSTNCSRCGPYSYKSSNSSCAVCPKDATCQSATCQANSGSVLIDGTPSIESFHAGSVGGRTLSAWLATYNDGSSSPLIHGGTSGAALVNPWFQVDVGQHVSLQGVDRIVFTNRAGHWGCRTFAQNNGNCGRVRADTSLVWNGTNEGALFGVSDNPISTFADTVPLQACVPGRRDCRCALLSKYNASLQHIVHCNGAIGRYVYMVLPGTSRMLNFGDMQVYATYTQFSPRQSTCVSQCTAPGCMAGRARCPSTPGGAGMCPADGCVSDVAEGVAYGFQAVSGGLGNCVRCSASQYLAANGRCTNCPGSCGGSSCQVQNTLVLGGAATQNPGQYASRTGDLARDGSLATYCETQTGSNPYWQLELDNTETVSSVIVTIRPDQCGGRSFINAPACPFGLVPPGSPADRDYSAADEGTIIKISTSACVNGQICPGTVCGSIVRPSSTNFTYTVTCTQPIQGTFVNIQVPGARRILQLADVVVKRSTTNPTC